MTAGRDAPQNRTVMYLCYGKGMHLDETVFSLLTALHHEPVEGSNVQYVVYTDNPGAFVDLSVVIREITEAELNSWMGSSDYIHRRKTMAILDALERFPGSLAFVDSDTYFRRSPVALFDRIGPGRSCLHVREAKLLETGLEMDRALHDLIMNNDFHDSFGNKLAFSFDEPMWNSGVIGVNSADIGVIRQAPHVIDQIWRKLRVHHVEQFVTGHLLGERTTVAETRDVVFHYWAPYLRHPFQKRLPEILASCSKLPLKERAEMAYRRRPLPSVSRWLKVRVREVSRQLGINLRGHLKSA